MTHYAKIAGVTPKNGEPMTPAANNRIAAAVSAAAPTNGMRVAKLAKNKQSAVAPSPDDDEALRPLMRENEHLSDIDDVSSNDDRVADQDESDGEAANGLEDADGADAGNRAYDNDDPEVDPDPDAEVRRVAGVGAADAARAQAVVKSKTPRKPRKPRAAPDPPERQQNITALKGLRGDKSGVDVYAKEALHPLVECAVVVAILDFYEGRRSSLALDNLWGALTTVVASNRVASIPHENFGLPEHLALPKIATQIGILASRLNMLATTAVSVDKEANQFRITFLAGATSISWQSLGDPAATAGAEPVHCEMVQAAVPASSAARLEITYADPSTKPQQITVASKFVPLIEAMLLTMRLPETVYGLVAGRLSHKSKANASVGKQKCVALAVALSDQTSQNVVAITAQAVNKAVTHLSALPTKFNDVRKTIVRGGAAAAVVASAAALAGDSGAMSLDFQ